MSSAPAITVIALCYNHERFLHECLESIRTQTCQNFELIVTDDASQDRSPGLIAEWIDRHRLKAHFIRHAANAGICRTLNEALARAQGKYIAMIATDDVWAPERLATQLAAMEAQGEQVAVVYSDAAQMDEDGQPLPRNFIEHHRPGLAPPSGKLFPALADGNFIPAMSTLIRRAAIDAVGGYDERLTYEDYDMWLRLAARFDFAYCPHVVARYRIVRTSVVRTLFVKPTANHSATVMLIRGKWMDSALLNHQQRRMWADSLWGAAYNLYALGDPRAPAALWQAARYTRNTRALLLAIAASLGLSRAALQRLRTVRARR